MTTPRTAGPGSSPAGVGGSGQGLWSFGPLKPRLTHACENCSVMTLPRPRETARMARASAGPCESHGHAGPSQPAPPTNPSGPHPVSSAAPAGGTEGRGARQATEWDAVSPRLTTRLLPPSCLEFGGRPEGSRFLRTSKAEGFAHRVGSGHGERGGCLQTGACRGSRESLESAGEPFLSPAVPCPRVLATGSTTGSALALVSRSTLSAVTRPEPDVNPLLPVRDSRAPGGRGPSHLPPCADHWARGWDTVTAPRHAPGCPRVSSPRPAKFLKKETAVTALSS